MRGGSRHLHNTVKSQILEPWFNQLMYQMIQCNTYTVNTTDEKESEMIILLLYSVNDMLLSWS